MDDTQHIIIITILLLWAAPNLCLVLRALQKHLTANKADKPAPVPWRRRRTPGGDGLGPGIQGETSTSRSFKANPFEDSSTA
jgi:hypothetical protein